MLRPPTPFEKYVRHPLEAVALGFVWLALRLLPVDAASGLAGTLARGLGPRLPASDRARNNIRRAFPDLGAAAVETIVADMWENLGRTVGEFPHVGTHWFGGENPRVRVEGLENLTAFRDDGEPGLFFSAHLANWELAPLTAVAHDTPSVFIYREANNRLVEKLYLLGRKDLQGCLLRKGNEGAKGMIQALSDGKHVGLLTDQKMNDGIAVPFFGIDAMTAPALATMALRFRCPVIGARIVRDQGARFVVRIEPPLSLPDSGDRDADIRAIMTEVNRRIEAWIKENPGQWLWLHNRWPG